MAATEHRVWVYGDNVNTDVIFPGKYTYTLKSKAEIASVALEDLDTTFADNVLPNDVIIAGRNWGSGSSREQAVTTLKFNGIHIIIAESFSRIYLRNCINQGLLPISISGLAQLVETGDVISIDREARSVTAKGQTFTYPALSPSIEAILDAGGLVPMLQAQFRDTSNSKVES